MRTVAALLVAVGMAASQAVLADELEPGKYTDSIARMGQRDIEQWGVAVVIESVEAGVAKGVATRYRGNCQGDVPIVGHLEGSTLTLRERAKGGRGGDCGFRATLRVEGKKLVGTTGAGEPLEMSR